jgi:hypothetical protein
MNDTVSKILSQDRSQKWFFIIAGTVFSGLAAYLFLFRSGIPAQLEQMWFAVMAFIAAGFAKGVNTVEKIMNKDLDGDGDIGVDNAPAPTIPAVEAPAVAQMEVIEIDPENDPGKYNLLQTPV